MYDPTRPLTYAEVKRDRQMYRDLTVGQVCALCGRTPVVLDHDHTTGLIRGPLCGFCNNGLGHFHDDPELLRRAAEYLTNPPVVTHPLARALA